jgi:hypothetical protein
MKADRDAPLTPGGKVPLRPGPARDRQTSSTIVVVVMIALVLLLLFAAWRWMQRTNAAPIAPMHSERQAPGFRRRALGARLHAPDSKRHDKPEITNHKKEESSRLPSNFSLEPNA